MCNKLIFTFILWILFIVLLNGQLKLESIDYFRSLKSDYRINYLVAKDRTDAFYVYGLKLLPSIQRFEFATDQDILTLRLFKSDRNYTMGVGFTWYGDGTAKNYLFGLPFFLKYIDKLYSYKSFNNCSTSYNFTLGIGVFTPDSIGKFEPVYNDRPFSSNLFLRAGRVYYKSLRVSFRTDFALGLLGTRIAEFVQTGIHSGQRIYNIDARPNPLGWHNQISDGGMISFQYNYLRSFVVISNYYNKFNKPGLKAVDSVDLILKEYYKPKIRYQFKFNQGLGVGISNYIKLGISLKWGIYREDDGEMLNTLHDNNNVDKYKYNSSTTKEIAVDTLLRLLIDKKPNCKVYKFEFYLFSEPELSFWMYNALLQGWIKSNDPHTFDTHTLFSYNIVRPFVFTYSFGIGIKFNRTIAKFAMMGKSPEFKTNILKWHHWGQASLGYSF